MSRLNLFFVGLAVAAFSTLHAQSINASSPDFFENKIRPILANSCYGCHTNSALSGLRLDSLDAMKKGGKRGAAITVGDPENSLLIKAVKHLDPNLKMPSGNKLKDSEIADLEAWIKGGAVWPKSEAPVAASASGKYVITPERRQFWSFKPLATPAVPTPKDNKWAKTEIDRFVMARLEKEGLHPVAAASKHDLLRRATLDLTGLLPTSEEYAAFDKDVTADAFGKAVDRLLASPHYGERWGRVWLDVARYGEDDYRSLNPNPRGYRPYPNAWAYRDWVVQSFNDNLPYDQFVKAQLAADQMDPTVRTKMLPATGFLGLGPWYYDNGSNEVTRADERHDRVDAVTRGFLGLTVQCARCHDHKYDPIPQSDYYALAGVFYNTIYEEYPRAPKKVVEDYIKLQDAVDVKQKMLGEMNSNLSTELSRTLVYQASNYLQGVFEVTGKTKKEATQVVEQRRLDFELLDRWVKYMAKPTDKYKFKADWQAMTKRGGTADEAKKLAEKFQDDIVSVMLEKSELDIENKIIADKDVDGTKPKKRTDKPSNFTSNKDFNPGALLQFKSMTDDRSNFWTEIFQRELKDAEDPNAMMAAGARLGNPGVLLFRGWGLESRVGPESQARIKVLQTDLEAARKKLDPSYPFIHGVKDAEKPVNIQLAIRGNPEMLGDEVQRHFLSVFCDGEPVPFSQGSGRLQMADLILAQPIAMRVMVNRIWKGHFGTGIVDTPSNFGFGGERPTNPELLEYLAASFRKNGMSVKKLHREIMLSSVYQLSTADDKVASDKDSGNRLYWRANRKRMDAEQVRDSILQVSGNLDNGLGGPSQDLTPDYKRRTIYGKVSRYKLDAFLQLFDFPSPNISAEKRFTTTVPLQRLFLMNSDFVQLEAEELAKRVAPEANNRARVRKMYNLVYGRDPNEQEVLLAIDYLKTEPMKEYEENKNKPKDEAGPGRGGRGRGGPGAGGPPPAAGADAATVSDASKSDMPKSDMPTPDMPAPDMPKTEVADAGGGAGGGGGMGMGMMGGMGGFGGGFGGPGGGRGRGGARPVEVKYEASAWGRYAKVLLSSTEFIFVN